MRMSATCRTKASRAGGFTLLELTIVLALVGLVAAVALPNLQRLYDAFVRETERARIIDQFAALGQRALAAGRAYAVLDADAADAQAYADYEPYSIDLPPGWALRVKRPVLVRANGFCLGGEVALAHTGGEAIELALAPPYCRPTEAD